MKKIVLISIVASMIISFSSCCGLKLHNPKVVGTNSTDLWLKSDKYDIKKQQSITVKDGKKYKILVFADIQLDGNPFRTKKTFKLLDYLVDSAKPDMIITLGDNSEWYYSDKMAKKLVKKLGSYGVPYAMVLGNHDAEGRKGRLWYGNLYEKAPNSLFKTGPSTIHGVGNYTVLLKDEKGNIIYDLIFMDSNAERNYPEGKGYDFIYPDQIEWYKWNVKGVSKAVYGEYNPEKGEVVPSMTFFHIPLPEFQDAIDSVRSGAIDSSLVQGHVNEGVASAKFNTGFFDVLKNMKSTTHVFNGHDHVNNISVPWQGIQLTYGLKSGYTSYFNENMIGGMVLTIDKEKGSKPDVDIKYIYVNKEDLKKK